MSKTSVEEQINTFRACTTCGLQGNRNRPPVRATHVATSKAGMQWYECGQHDDYDHAAAMGAAGDELERRVSLIALREWMTGVVAAAAITPAPAPSVAAVNTAASDANKLLDEAKRISDETDRKIELWRPLVEQMGAQKLELNTANERIAELEAELAKRPPEPTPAEPVTPEAIAEAERDVTETQAAKQAEADELGGAPDLSPIEGDEPDDTGLEEPATPAPAEKKNGNPEE